MANSSIRVFVKYSWMAVLRLDEIYRSHHIHMYQTGHPDIARHLDFRDYLIAHLEDAQAYSRLKEDLARRYPTDAASYVAGKDGLVKELDRKAKAWREAIERGIDG
jgi:GrpB-like predicted nucleotidyltransferase (UPF0157 family)